METETPAVTPEPEAELGRVHSFAGKALEPFSFARQAALQRLRIGSESPLESAAMLVFLCLQTPARIDRARGEDGCAAFRLELADWCDRQRIGLAYTDEAGIKRGSRAGHEVRELADAIWADIAAAESEPDLKDGKDNPDPNA